MIAQRKPIEKITTVWEPSLKQAMMISCPIFEILFGGARGGGKSDGVLGEWASHADQYASKAIGLCIRRTHKQLVELIERSKVLYAPLGATYHVIESMWRFPNGARLRFAYLENDSDAQNYQGHSYTRLYVEEMGTFPNFEPIMKLMATLGRDPTVPAKFIATANPGGPGHSWIKQRYIDPAPLGFKILDTEWPHPFDKNKKITKQRVFIPSGVQDNPYTNTPEYIANLYMSGNEELVKAWLFGDWNIIAGAFFTEWDTRKHVIRTFDVPKNWTRFMSMDWGSAKPFSVGWWCVVPDEFDVGLEITPNSWRLFQDPSLFKDNKLMLPKNSIIRYREWYGSQPNPHNPKEGTNKGLKLTAEEIAEGIAMREQREPRNEYNRARISYRVIDPSAFKEDGGPSFVERMANHSHIYFNRADNSRVSKNGAMGGWDQLRARLKGEDGRPMIYFMDNCVDSVRTLPALQHDEDKMEDVDSTGEDHAPDEIRYACMSRPYHRPTQIDTIRSIFKNNDNTSMVLHDMLDDFAPRDGFKTINGARVDY